MMSATMARMMPVGSPAAIESQGNHAKQRDSRLIGSLQLATDTTAGREAGDNLICVFVNHRR